MAWGGWRILRYAVFCSKLAERELIELPPVRKYKRSGPQTVGWVRADFEHTPEPLCAELEQIRPVQLDWVEAGSDRARRVAFYLDRYHYLGWHVVGQNIGCRSALKSRPAKTWGSVDGVGCATFGWRMEEEAKIQENILGARWTSLFV